MKPIIAFVTVLTCVAAFGADLKVTDKPVPKEVGPSIQKLIAPKSVQVGPFELWLVAELPGKSLESLKQATLLGVVSVPKSARDYRDDEIAAGVYTMRFILQPQDGNHLGTSELPQFAALTPAKLDTKPDGITDYKSLVKASSKETSTDHPMILSLRPVSSASGEFPRLEEPAPEHKSVRVKVSGAEKTAIVFDIVYEGKGHK